MTPHEHALREHAEWEWHCMQVEAFARHHGHVEMGAHPAAEWLRRQQARAQHGELSKERRARLEALGVALPRKARRSRRAAVKPLSKKAEAAWEAMFAQLDAWQRLHGHCEVWPQGREQAELARWVKVQRRLHVARRLTQEQSARLDALGLFRDRSGTDRAQLWEQRFQELAAFAREHGHTNVTKKQNKVLGHWRDVQREFRRKGMLKAERVARLEAIGFEWEAAGREGRGQEAWHQQLWEEKLERLRAFKSRFGHCHVPVLWKEDRKLGEWVAEQRKRWREGKLAADRVERLEGMGFEWKVPHRFFQPPFPTERRPAQGYIELWERRYAEMAAFAREHGHTNVTQKQNKVLGHWRDVQREFRRKGRLSAERIARLEAIGFEWEAPQNMGQDREAVRERLWEEKLERLRAFQQRFGHTQVPKDWPEDPKLATWVSEQRRAKSQGHLLAERKARLDELGFDWQPVKVRMRIARRERNYPETLNVLWERRYAELVAFHAQHGHCRVPNKRPEVRELCKWCYSQRHLRRAGKLRAERVARLDALGFRWDATEVPGLSYAEVNEQRWEQSFARLVAFHARFGHAHVPVRWEVDPELGGWVYKQRHKARQGRLAPEKRARLDALGFPWQPDNSPPLKPRPPQNFPKPAHEKVWLRHLEELRAFHEEHGHFRVPSKMGELWRWCKAQQKDARRGKLTPGRRAALEALGFPWEL